MSCKTRRVGAVSLCIFIFSFLATFTATISTETDIACLKSVKASLEDPFGYLNSSWNFNNNTEGFICRFTGVDCWHFDENKVLNLRLSDMGLKGQFPRGLQNCTSLTGLDLSNNDLYGQIPFDIQKLLPYVTVLDLSSNNFSGEIPLSIANCSNLNVLRLDQNSLTGHIPQEIGLLSRLKTFSVAYNLLSGAVPNFNSTTIGSDSYANNSGLCGRPLERCRDHLEKFHWRFVYSFKDGFAIGYAVSLISAIVIYASYCVPWVHKGTKDERITIPTMVMMMMKRKSKKTELDHLESSSTLEFLLENEVSMRENFVTRMSFEELSNATENFSQNNIIENGETGIMYKATLPNVWFLAVKKIYNSQESEEHFISELKILGRLRHDHLLPLLGFCKESNKRLLVYKYLSNGNLFDWLHSTEDKRKTLQWPLRMKIAVGLARGLAWLHHCCYFRVAHLNINSKSVLLDQNFKPKLSNFGRATLINPNEINSNRGFVMDIEFWERFFLKEDVFNYGILLIELITGKNAATLNTSDGSLDKWVSYLSSNNSYCLHDFVDELLIWQGHDDEIFQCLQLACTCVQEIAEQRPSMLDVYTTISTLGGRYGHIENEEQFVQSEIIDAA